MVVYNFLVDGLHNYAVGQDEVLVHNTNGPGKEVDDGYKPKTRDSYADHKNRRKH
jgi:hypothetical protein